MEKFSVLFTEQASYGKEQERLRKQERMLKSNYKTLGGPVTKASIQILEDFTL